MGNKKLLRSFIYLSLCIEMMISTKVSLIDPKRYVKIYSSCDPSPDSPIHLNNGLYYIKPTDDGPIIPVICSNGYTMIDVSLDTNLKSIPSYLSSWDYSRPSTDYIIPNLDDTSSFREWWRPSDRNTKFRVAKECQSCEQASDVTLKDNVVYYTDSYLFCYTSYEGENENACFDKVNQYSCNVCDIGRFSTTDTALLNHRYWSQCSALQMASDIPSLHEPQMRVNHHLIYRPVMSLTRSACTCYQPQNKDETLKQYTVAIDQLPLVTIGANRVITKTVVDTVAYIDDMIQLQDIYVCDPNKEDCTDATEDERRKRKCAANKVYLRQNDFESGTYRVRECGEYILSEDIICNFNAPSSTQESDPTFSPNRIDGDELYWFPTRQQAEKDNEYPGLYTYVGSFSLGFFAAITIEADDVVINLNGFTLAMDRRFYVQQRFFSLIELAAKMFEPLQGPSSWGVTNEFYASNVEIKGPGTLGLTSHHAIHGNKAAHVSIHDIEIQHFDVAGIACNGCQYVDIAHVSVGPQNNNIPTLGRYTHARAFLPRLKHLHDKFGDEAIKFYGRAETTVADLCQRMIRQMDMIYHYAVNDVQYEEEDEEWMAANKLFKNPTGWMDGGSSYGVVINGIGAAVVGIGARIESTNHIHINDVEIFGIYNKAIEKVKFSLQDDTTRGILFEAVDWISTTDQLEDRSRSQYIGDCYTDIQFAAARFIDSWYFRNSYYVGQEEIDYVFKGNTAETNYPFLTILPEREDFWNSPITRSCGTDIQLHSSKGAIGMMVNGAQESTFDDIYIHDVYNWADLGSDICGPYDQIHVTFEDIDIQYGYTGTRAHGLVVDYVDADCTNIHIENIESYHGEATGMTVYKGAFVNLMNIRVNNIAAGTQLNDDEVEQLTLPNVVPTACSVDIREDTVVEYLEGDARDNLRFHDIDGFIVCDPFMNDELNDAPQWQWITVFEGLAVFGFIAVVGTYSRGSLYKGWNVSYEEETERTCENTPLLTQEKYVI